MMDVWRWLLPTIVAIVVALGSVAFSYGALHADTTMVKTRVEQLEEQQNKAAIDLAVHNQELKDIDQHMQTIQHDVSELLKRK